MPLPADVQECEVEDDLEADLSKASLLDGIKFESEPDQHTLCCLLGTGMVICAVLVWTSALSMCSSNYTKHPSQLDVLMLSADILSIDLYSCGFVLCGYISSFVYVAVGNSQWQQLRTQLCWTCYTIALCSNLISMLTCSLWHVYLGEFRWCHLGLTLFEGVTCVRLFDVNQSKQHMHSLNVFVWPILILFWCFYALEFTWTGNKKISGLLGQHSHYLLVVLALCGICLFTLFGMLHSSTNIFYANATSMAYRTLEFNCGVHMHFLREAEFGPLLNVMKVLAQCQYVIYFVFCATWWSEIGVDATQTNRATCLRLYAGNNCLRDHHAFLLRGCVLGATVISSIDSVKHSMLNMQSLLNVLPVIPAAMALCCPLFSLLLFVFVCTFSPQLVYENMACVVLVLVVLLWLLAYLFSVQVQPVVQELLRGQFKLATDSIRHWWVSNFITARVQTPAERVAPEDQ